METPERHWSAAYWDGIEPEDVGQSLPHHSSPVPAHPAEQPAADFFPSTLPADAVPLESLDVLSLPSPLLQRVVSHALHHLRVHHPSAQSPSLYFLSILHTRVRCSPLFPPIPVLVCRLWPSALFTGQREGEAEKAAVRGMDLWYTANSGEFVQVTDLEKTDSATIGEPASEVLAVKERSADGGRLTATAAALDSCEARRPGGR